MIEVAFRYMEEQAISKLNKAGVNSARASKPTWTKAFELLRYELARINATNVVVEAGYKPNQVRADGWPYSNAVPEHQQLRVSFKRGAVAMSFFQGGFAGGIACVAYNAWLIGMTLQALRAVDRYGCTQSGQQYAGWAQLPPGRGPIAAAEWASIEDAVRWLMRQADYRVPQDGGVGAYLSGEPLRDLYRDAAKRTHPDAGGSADLFATVTRAHDYIQRGGQT